MRRTTSRDAILEHVRRYSLTVNTALCAVFGLEPDAAYKAVRRLEVTGLLHSYPICGRKFVQLTSKGAAYIGAPRNMAEEYGSQALRRHYATLSFCCLHRPRKERLLPSEFAERYPDLAGKPRIDPSGQDWYVDTYEGKERLGRITLDFYAEPERVVRKLRGIVRDIQAIPAAAAMLDDDFILTVLTYSERKREAIKTLLGKQKLPTLTRVVTIPEMAHIPAGGKHEG